MKIFRGMLTALVMFGATHLSFGAAFNVELSVFEDTHQEQIKFQRSQGLSDREILDNIFAEFETKYGDKFKSARENGMTDEDIVFIIREDAERQKLKEVQTDEPENVEVEGSDNSVQNNQPISSRVFINLSKYEKDFGDEIRAGRRLGFGDDTILNFIRNNFTVFRFTTIEDEYKNKIQTARFNGFLDAQIIATIARDENNKNGIIDTSKPVVVVDKQQEREMLDRVDRIALENTIGGKIGKFLANILILGIIAFFIIIIPYCFGAHKPAPKSVHKPTEKPSPGTEYQKNGNKVVYCHRRKTDMIPFYIGLGSERRAFDFVSRNHNWKAVYYEHGCHVEILHTNLTPQQAAEIEIKLIAEYRKKYPGKMTNISNGGETGTGNYGPRRRYKNF